MVRWIEAAPCCLTDATHIDDDRRMAAKASALLGGVCVAVLGLAGCGDRSIASTDAGSSTSETASSGTTGTSDAPPPPDLGPGAIVCGEPGENAASDEEISLLEGCEIYEGNIAALHITDLSPLASLRVLRGALSCNVSNYSLETLEGLEQLEWAGGFHVTNNGLQGLSAVESLTSVDAGFSVVGMPNFVDLGGVEKLRTVGGRLWVDSNPELTSLDGLSGLEWVGGELSIVANDKLISLDGLSALQQVDGDVTIRLNLQLPQADIEGFLSRIEIGGDVNID